MKVKIIFYIFFRYLFFETRTIWTSSKQDNDILALSETEFEIQIVLVGDKLVTLTDDANFIKHLHRPKFAI